MVEQPSGQAFVFDRCFIMKSKTCSVCKDNKLILDFYKSKGGKFGRHSICKICMLNYQNERHNKEEIKKYRKEYSANRWKNRFEPKIEKRIISLEEKRINRKKICYKYYLNNKDIILKRLSVSGKIRRNEDIIFKLTGSLRHRIWSIFKSKGIKKHKTTEKLLGISFEMAKKHIERQFTKGMNWSNYGIYGWHIDHIIPLSSVTTEEELIKLCHYTNLQPLWAIDNIKKSNKILPIQTIMTF